jgi:hypothetical protein
LVVLQGRVIETATLGDVHVMQINDVSTSSDSVSIRGDTSIHVVGFSGNTTSTGSYSHQDAVLIARSAVKLQNGFSAFPEIDPLIIGDFTGDGTLSALDAAYVARKARGLPSLQFAKVSGESKGASSLASTLSSQFVSLASTQTQLSPLFHLSTPSAALQTVPDVAGSRSTDEAEEVSCKLPCFKHAPHQVPETIEQLASHVVLSRQRHSARTDPEYMAAVDSLFATLSMQLSGSSDLTNCDVVRATDTLST